MVIVRRAEDCRVGVCLGIYWFVTSIIARTLG